MAVSTPKREMKSWENDLLAQAENRIEIKSARKIQLKMPLLRGFFIVLNLSILEILYQIVTSNSAQTTN